MLRKENLVLVLVALAAYVDSYNVLVKPRSKYCFGENLKKSFGEATLEIQVSSGGDADITFQLQDPFGNIIDAGERIRSTEHPFNITHDGPHQICLDNTFSSSSAKTVMVEVHQAEPDQMQRNLRKHFQIEPGNAEAEGLKQEFVDLVRGLTKNSDKLERYSETAAAKKRRNFFLIQSNLSRVNWFSGISCVFMITVGVLQVFIVKGLFEDGTKRRFKFW